MSPASVMHRVQLPFLVALGMHHPHLQCLWLTQPKSLQGKHKLLVLTLDACHAAAQVQASNDPSTASWHHVQLRHL